MGEKINNIILSIVAVGDTYINETLPNLYRFINKGYIIKILTDQPNRYSDLNVETFYYDNKLFSYFDKLTFPLKLSEKYKSNVLYIDADRLSNLTNEFIDTFDGEDEFLFYKTWPHGETFRYYKDDYYFKILLDYFHKKNITDYEDLVTILEWIFYFPYYGEKISDLLVDIERIKPIFEYMSIMVDSRYSGIGIGNGEGIALSYVLNKNKISMNKFKNHVFDI
jgi:hypothetical protein